MCPRPHPARSAEGSRHAEEPPAQQVELGAPAHLALEHLQAVDVAFGRAMAPGQPEAGFHGLVVRAEACGKAPPRRYTTPQLKTAIGELSASIALSLSA